MDQYMLCVKGLMREWDAGKDMDGEVYAANMRQWRGRGEVTEEFEA